MYQQNDGLWYFRYKDDDGKWRTFATHTRDKAVAQEMEAHYKTLSEAYRKPRLLSDLILIFSDPKRNPEFLDSRITGKMYGPRHSEEVARNMRDLAELLKDRSNFSRMKLKDVTRMDCKTIMTIVHRKYGNTSKANKVFSQFKRCLTYASEQGWIPASPSQGMSDIKAEKRLEVVPMTPNDIAEIISSPELFRFSREACNAKTERLRDGRQEEDYAMFCLLAMTGMRRAEAAALTSGQICSGIYRGRAFHYIDINRAYKDDGWTEIGKPKWDLCRSIPVCEELYSILKPYIGDSPDDMLFSGYGKTRFRQMFARLKENIALDGTVLEDEEAFAMLSPHKLRHALNTNLLADQGIGEGKVTENMVAEYLSWEHQDQSRMQRRYTHMVASRLLPVSDLISRIYSTRLRSCGGATEGIVTKSAMIV